MKNRICPVCGKEFEAAGRRKNCSAECSNKADYMKAQKHKTTWRNTKEYHSRKELILTNGLEIMNGCFAQEVYGCTKYWDRRIKLNA